MQNYFRATSYINHWLDAVDEHSIHSPFFYEFYHQVIKSTSDRDHFLEIEKTREVLLSNETVVSVKDLGAKSPHFKSDGRTISKIAATSLSPEKHCALFYRIAKYTEAKRIVELGTSMGITSLYLSKIERSKVITFEGNPWMINIAKSNFEYFHQKNIQLIEGNINQTLPDHLQNPVKIDFALLDANHRYEPTLQYFEWLSKRMADRGVMVIDDIYYSEEMGKAWRELKKHDLVYGSIDLYRCGILFFDIRLNKQHFVWSL
ncbi:MAG: class I SAM-dependent methyltransferase [Bacteroidetes bacterium]|nr:class I SAM-dependent methyltransferase [Bacteroidota bacterium]